MRPLPQSSPKKKTWIILLLIAIIVIVAGILTPNLGRIFKSSVTDYVGQGTLASIAVDRGNISNSVKNGDNGEFDVIFTETGTSTISLTLAGVTKQFQVNVEEAHSAGPTCPENPDIQSCDEGFAIFPHEGTAGCPDYNTCDPIPIECGNNQVEIGEGCDDGNTVDGDGCSATCTGELPAKIMGASFIPESLNTDAVNIMNAHFEVLHRDVLDNSIIEIIFPAGFILNAGNATGFVPDENFFGGFRNALVQVDGQRVKITSQGGGAVIGIPRNTVVSFQITSVRNPTDSTIAPTYTLRLLRADGSVIDEVAEIIGVSFQNSPVPIEPPPVVPPPVEPPQVEPPLVEPPPVEPPPVEPPSPVEPPPVEPAAVKPPSSEPPKQKIPKITIQGPVHPTQGEPANYTYTIEWIDQP